MLISERTPLLWSLVAFVEGPKSKRREIGTTTRKREPRFRLHYSREIRVYLCCGAVYYESREKADTRRRSDKGRGGEREREEKDARPLLVTASSPSRRAPLHSAVLHCVRPATDKPISPTPSRSLLSCLPCNRIFWISSSYYIYTHTHTSNVVDQHKSAYYLHKRPVHSDEIISSLLGLHVYIRRPFPTRRSDDHHFPVLVIFYYR